MLFCTIFSDDDRFEIVEEHKSEGLRNILVIHGASETDFGDYNCSVVNEYGIARKLIRLNEESENSMNPSLISCVISIIHVSYINTVFFIF